MFEYATGIIADIYQEGDIDIVFFGQLLGFVSARQTSDGEAIPYKKPPEQCMQDAIKLAEFCVSSGDFYVHRGNRNADDSFSYLRFESDTREFEEFVWAQFEDEGIDSINLFFATSLVKLLPGRRMPSIPRDILALVCG